MIRRLYKILLVITLFHMWDGSIKPVGLIIHATDLGIDLEVLSCNLC